MVTAMVTLIIMAMGTDSRISGPRNRASDDRPKRGGLRRLLRDSREDVLALPFIVGRERLFLQGL